MSAHVFFAVIVLASRSDNILVEQLPNLPDVSPELRVIRFDVCLIPSYFRPRNPSLLRLLPLM